jgi:hypothetical protein
VPRRVNAAVEPWSAAAVGAAGEADGTVGLAIKMTPKAKHAPEIRNGIALRVFGIER